MGLSLLAVCAACLALWLTTTSFGIRAIGLASGAAGAYFTWGGINGLKEERK